MNLATVLLDPEVPADAPALVQGAGTVTHGHLAARSGRLAAELVATGVSPGDRVAICGSNRVGFVVAYLAVLRAGGVAVPLNPQAPPAELAREVRAVEPRLALACPGAPALDGPAGASGAAVIEVADDAGTGDVEQLDVVERADDDVAVLLFTSGTAGPPKAAMLTHGNLAANLRQVQSHPGLALRGDDVGLGLLPFFHVFGCNVVLGVPLVAGASVVLVDHFDPSATLGLVRERGITVVAGVPTMYDAWLELSDAEAPADSLRSVRLAVSGAASLAPETAERMRERFGVIVYEGYGLTEASPIVTSAVLDPEPRPGSIGPPLPGVEVRLVDVDGSDVLAGDPGEIWVRGPNVFPGYWRDDDATRRVLTPDGWLRTGDVAVADERGELTLVDRTKDLVIVSGFNVYPAEVEEVLREHPDVDDVAVVGEASPRTGEAVVAFVVPAGDGPPSVDDLIAFAGEHLARYKVPARVEVVDEIPRTLVGKVIRRELRGGGT